MTKLPPAAERHRTFFGHVNCSVPVMKVKIFFISSFRVKFQSDIFCDNKEFTVGRRKLPYQESN